MAATATSKPVAALAPVPTHVPSTSAPSSTALSSLKRALIAFEAAFTRQHGRAPKPEDVKTKPIAATYREYEQLKAEARAHAAATGASPNGTATASGKAASKAPHSAPSSATSSAPSQRTATNGVRVQAQRKLPVHPSAVAALALAVQRRAQQPPSRAPPPAAALSVTSLAATPVQPACPPVAAPARPTPVARFCAGPRHARAQATRKKNSLLAQLSEQPPPAQPYNFENEMRQRDEAGQRADAGLSDEGELSDASSEVHEKPAPHQFASVHATSPSAATRQSYVSSDDDFDREMDIELEIEQERSFYDHAPSEPSVNPLPSSTSAPRPSTRTNPAPPMSSSHDDDSRSVSPVEPASSRVTRAAAPKPATRGRQQLKRPREEEEDEQEESCGSGDMSDDDGYYDSNSEGAYASDESAFDEDQPVESLRASAADSATPAKVKKPRAARPTKLKPEKVAKKTTGAISRNYVRHDTHRKNGIQRGPKSGKALRAAKFRQQAGAGRWKTKAEYARDQAQKVEQGMYCEMLKPQELKNVVESVVLGVNVSGDDGTDDEMAAFRQLERDQFGVQHQTMSDVEAELDPLSLVAEAKEKKRKAVKAQAEAATLAATKSPSLGAHSDASLLALLREQFRYEQFRPGQLDTIKHVLNCHEAEQPGVTSSPSANASQNVLAIMATGSGKSLIYQLLSLLLPGLTIIVSPLLSLMKDQLEHLPPFLRGAIWSSENTPRSVLELMNDLQANQIKILFISPEKLLTSGFQSFILESVLRTKASPLDFLPGGLTPTQVPGISLVVIDEVHCLAEWSHNFRNSYSRLDHVLNNVFHVPRILGLTATATVSTTNQVCANLRIPPENIVRGALTRENLLLSTSLVKHEERFSALVDLLNAPPFKGLKSIIVYVNYKSISEALTKYLKQHGFPSCDYYHAGLPLFQRHKVQAKFMGNKLSICIATCAFGMGLDKCDIRGVIHFNLPRSFENYIQEIGRAGRDGDLSYCHAMWSHCDKEISGSLLYSNGVDQYQLKRLLDKVFDDSKRIQAPPSLAAMDEEDEALFQYRHYVPLEVEPLRINMELSEEVVGTILARLERTLGRQWIRLVASIHNTASIGFHKTNPKVLALSSGVIRNLLEQNHWLPRSSHHSRYGVTFDHERAATSFDAQQLAASGAASMDMPDYNSAEFQQLKQQKGMLTMNLCEAAIQCGMEITDVQREIVRLKAAGEISVQWSNMSFIIQVLEWPVEPNYGAYAMTDESDASRTLDAIVADLLVYLQKQESMASGKLSIMAAALQMASLTHMRCAPHDAVDRARRMRKLQLKQQLKQRAKKNAAAATVEDEEEDDDPQQPFFDLHKVMDAYFAAEDPSEFLEQLRTQCAEAEADAPTSTTQANAAKNLARLAREFEEDVHSFLRVNGESVSSGRELARICHGQKAPSHLAVGRSTWQRDRRQNGGGDADADGALSGMSPFAGHAMWGRYKSIDFPTVLAKCDQWIQQWKTSAGSRHAEEAAAHEKRRLAKRQRLIQHAASITSNMPASTPTPASRPLPATVPAGRSLAPATTATTAAAATNDDDLIIPGSDDEA